MRRIYIFDSGVGGLSLVRFLHRMDAGVSIIYVADAINFPYGDKDEDKLRSILRWHIDKAIQVGADAVAIACNTMSSVVPANWSFPLPVFHLFDGWGEHLSLYSNPVVITTVRTFKSGYYQRLLSGGRVVPMPQFVSAIQLGDIDGILTAMEDLREIAFRIHADAIVLGCTHFSFIYEMFKEYFSVPIEDPALGLAQRLFHIVGSGRFTLEFLGKTSPEYDMAGALARLPGGKEVLGWPIGSTLTISGVWPL